MKALDVKGVFVLVAAASLVFGFTVPIPAQEADSGEEEVQQERPVAVGEVVVTAQKRTENIQEVPVAVTALSGEDLEVITAGAPDVRTLSARVPSLILESSFGRAFPRFYIRGLGNTDFDLNASQPVSMIVDEVVLENPVVKGMPLFDLQQVEVLRGPQGTLFGRNTPAGIVKFDTRKPTREFDADFRASYGSFDTVDINGGVGGPLSDTLSARASVLFQSRSDWIDNRAPGHEKKDALGGYDTTAYRLQFLWEPNEKFSALLNVHGWDVDGTARLFRGNLLLPGTNNIRDEFEFDEVYYDGRNQQDIEAQGGVLKMEYDFGFATFTSITGYETLEMYSRGDIDGGYGAVYAPPSGPWMDIPFTSESADGIPDLDQVTQEFRLSSNGGERYDWILGLFYFDEELQADTFSFDTLAGGIQDGYSYQRQEATSYSAFGSMTYHANDQWDLTAGLRFSSDEKDFMAERPDPTFQLPTSAPILEKTDDDMVSWDLSATYKMKKNFNIYGRIATGFRAPSIQGRILFCADFDGGTNPATNCVTVADTEEILSGEVGFKSILADQRVRLNMTAYYYEVDGQQVTAVGGEYNTATLLNVDSTIGYGLEMDMEFIPNPNFFATVGMSYNPTEIDDPNLTVAPCGGGCTVTDPIVDGLAYVDGNPLPHAPEFIANAILNYHSDPVNKGIFGALDFSYYSEKNFFLYESREFRGDGMEIGIRLGYGWDGAKYEVALFGRNLTDEEIVRNGIDFDNLTGMMNDPRTIGIEFVGRF